MPLREPPPRGTVEQHGRRPFRGAVPMLLLLFKSRSSSWRISRKQLDARASINLYSWPCGRHGWRYPLRQMSSGHLSVARLQDAAGPCFRRLRNFIAQSRVDPRRNGTKGKKHRSRHGSLGRRFATRPALPTQASIIPAQPRGNPHKSDFLLTGGVASRVLSPDRPGFHTGRGSRSGRCCLAARPPIIHPASRPDHRQDAGLERSRRCRPGRTTYHQGGRLPVASRLLVAEQNRPQDRVAPLPLLAAPPAPLLVQPPADFPETQVRRGQELGPADRFLLFPVWQQSFVVVRVQPPAEAQTVNAADPFDRRWLTPIALDLRGRNAGREANGLDLR